MIGPLKPSDRLDIARVNSTAELAEMQVKDVGRFIAGGMTSLASSVRFSGAESFSNLRSAEVLISGGEHLEGIVVERPIASALALGGVCLALRARSSLLLAEERHREMKHFPTDGCL